MPPFFNPHVLKYLQYLMYGNTIFTQQNMLSAKIYLVRQHNYTIIIFNVIPRKEYTYSILHVSLLHY